jgi:hypothetical protein
MTAEPAGGSDTWLLQLPHHWSTSVGTELRMHAGDGQTSTATCNDDEGTTYAVEVEACKPGQPIYVFAMHSGQVQMQTCSRRATWIHSQAVLASHEQAAQPLATPTARKQAGSTPQLVSDGSRPIAVMQTPQNGKKAAKAAKRLHDGKQTTDKEKKTAKVKKSKRTKD